MGPVAVAACAALSAPYPPPPARFIGCFEAELGGLRGQFADSFLVPLPESVHLTARQVTGPWPGSGLRFFEIIPNDPEHQRYWSDSSVLPSEIARRQLPSPHEDHYIPGDSVDLYFPGPVGTLVLRVKDDSEGNLTGRSEWINLQRYPVHVPPLEVRLTQQDCPVRPARPFRLAPDSVS